MGFLQSNTLEIAALLLAVIFSVLYFKYFKRLGHRRIKAFTNLLELLYIVSFTIILLSSLGLLLSELRFMALISGILSRYMFYLILGNVVLGLTVFYPKKDAVILEIDKSKAKEREAEARRERRFTEKFYAGQGWGMHTETPASGLFLKVLKSPAVLVCKIVKRIYSEGPVHISVLCIIIAVGMLIQLMIIGNFYFWTDEVFTFNAAKMIIEKGEPIYDSGLNYSRASIYHRLIAFFMDIYGVDEFGSRILNVLSNSLIAVLIYLVLRRTSKLSALLGSFLFMFSGLTVLMTVETRFYCFFALLFLVTAITYYKAFVETDQGDNLCFHLKSVCQKPLWAILFLFSLYLAYDTHNFFFLIFFGLLLYYLLNLLLVRFSVINLFYLLLYIAAILAGSYYLTGTFNIYSAFFESVTLSWAVELPRNPAYYTDILKKTIPFYNILMAASIMFVLLKCSREQRYYFSLLIAVFFIISNQRALQERYLFFLLPIVTIVVALAIYYLYHYLKGRSCLKYTMIALFIVFLLFQLHYFVVEARGECGTYCLAFHKKMAFQEAMETINRNRVQEETVIIADHHAAYTLIAYDFEVQYILIPPHRLDLLERGRETEGRVYDPYFLIPYTVLGSAEFLHLIENRPVIAVMRDDIVLPDDMIIYQEQRPRVYMNY